MEADVLDFPFSGVSVGQAGPWPCPSDFGENDAGNQPAQLLEAF